MKISTILDQIDLGSMALPEFQRGYVWNRDQVRGLMHSLYYKHPVGSLLVWVTKTETADTRGEGEIPPGTVKLLLDGQQRITSLYGIMRGKTPKFFEGNEKAFKDLYFNLEDKVFEFFAPLKMKDNPYWIDVTKLTQVGIAEFWQKLSGAEGIDTQKMNTHINRLNSICSIGDIDLHIEEVTGEEKTVDVVVDIFNRVNSGGTKLSKGDLALAKICAAWPEARTKMNERLKEWKNQDFKFTLEWLLRVINAIITGEALFSALKDVELDTFKDGLSKAADAIDKILNMISARLGLDHNRVLGSRYSFPLIARYLIERGGHLRDYRERNKLLYWYINTFLWGRYAGSTESILLKDLNIIKDGKGSVDELINELRRDRGDLKLNPEDFSGWGRGSRFYPMLYMLTRVWKAKDFETGIELSDSILGRLSGLQVHHIFPKSILYENKYSKAKVNAVANFTFLTQETNLLISDRDPSDYLQEHERKNPGVLASHWIPQDPKLWKIENYLDFLAARRELLATAANSFLESLLSGQLPEKQVPVIERERELIGIPGRIESDEEEQLLNDCNQWIMKQGLSEGKIGYELLDPETEELLATLDLAWPNGLQEGLSEPVTLLIGEGKEMEEIVNRAGYRYFTNVEDFERYVNSEILGLTNKPVKRPDTTSESGSGSIELEVTVEGRLEKYPPKIKELFNLLDQEIKSISDDIWRKVGTTLLSYSCPKRTFIYVRFQKQGVKLTVFTGGQQIDGVKNVDYEKAGAKWGRIYFKNEDDLQSVMAAIKKSYELIREAIKKNENTSWYAKLEDEIENDATDV